MPRLRKRLAQSCAPRRCATIAPMEEGIQRALRIDTDPRAKDLNPSETDAHWVHREGSVCVDLWQVRCCGVGWHSGTAMYWQASLSIRLGAGGPSNRCLGYTGQFSGG